MGHIESSADWLNREKAEKWAASTLPYALGEKEYRFTVEYKVEYPLELGKK